MEIPQGLFDHITTNLIPINELSVNRQKLLLDNLVIETHPLGSYLFEQGDIDDNVYYLLAGKINMMATDESSFMIDANADQSFYPIGQMQPRQYSAHIINSAQTLKISKSLFDSLLESDKTESSIQLDSDDSDAGYDWMTHLLKSKIFTTIPPQNLQKIFALFEEVSIKENDKIINQGDQGEFFYIIKDGQFEVSRRLEKQNKTFKLATLQEGETFGEESLLGDIPRNASVTAKTDGTLMRISKDSFLSLIRDPAIKSLDYDEAIQLIKKGGIWLDVRFQDEYNRNALMGSLNVPLNTLRIQIKKLDVESEYVVYCDNGARSTIAAYLLLNKGYKVSFLKGGISKYQKQGSIKGVKTDVLDNESENTEQPVVLEAGIEGLVKQKEELHSTEEMVQTILSQQSDKDQLSKALRTVLASVFKQLEQALTEKAEAEIAKNIAEQKLGALQKQINEPNQWEHTDPGHHVPTALV